MLHVLQKNMVRHSIFITTFLLSLFLLVEPVLADRNIDSVTLNGSSSVSVAPSASITTSVTVTTNALNDKNWRATSWNISGANCINHTDHNGAGTYNESFTVTAPSSYGTYNISFIAYADSACTTAPSSTYTLTGGIVVSGPTPTPTPTTGPTPTPTPTLAPGQPTPTPTSTPTTSSSSSSSGSTTYYPSLSLDTFQNPTNRSTPTFSGMARVEQGSISLVEYSLTDAANWIQAQPADGNFNSLDERFVLTTAKLSDGNYNLKIRAKTQSGVFTQEASYVSTVFTVVTTPPLVTLDIFTPNPTTDTTPSLAGKVTTKLASIAKIEVSLDDGKSWHTANRFGNRFNFTPTTLEDNDYQIIARALDNAGNLGLSDSQTLVIDTIPPIIGGGMMSIGPQVLTPKENGNVSTVVGAQTTIALSMKGGVTQAQVQSDSAVFPLTAKKNSNIWVGEISFDTQGEKSLSVLAVDGAGNSTQREFNTLIVERPGVVIDKTTSTPIKSATISLYFYDPISTQWSLWEAESYGQNNPQLTSDGTYNFILPAGKYYFETRAKGYEDLQSEIFTLTQTSVRNYTFPLSPKARIEITLPFLGHFQIIIPSFTPPDTFSIESTTPESVQATEKETFRTGIPASNFSLPDLQGELIQLSSFRGKKLLISFISPWSTLSLEQASILSQLTTSLSQDQASLVVSLQESLATTQTLMNRGRYQFPVVVDKDGETAAIYQVSMLPHHVLIDSNGEIQKIVSGVFTKEELLEKLSSIQ